MLWELICIHYSALKGEVQTMEKRYFNVVCEELGVFGCKIIHVDKNAKDMDDVHKIVCDNILKYPS